jgi:hypothetical protein
LFYDDLGNFYYSVTVGARSDFARVVGRGIDRSSRKEREMNMPMHPTHPTNSLAIHGKDDWMNVLRGIDLG